MIENNFLKPLIRKNTLQTVLYCLFFGAFGLLGFILNYVEIKASFFGAPIVSTVAELNARSGMFDKAVTIVVPDLYDPGGFEGDARRSVVVNPAQITPLFYGVAAFPDGYLLVEMPVFRYSSGDTSFENTSIMGVLKPSYKSYNVYGGVVKSLSELRGVSEEEAGNIVCEAVLDTDISAAGIVIGVAGAAIFSLCAVILVKSLIVMIAPAKHGIYRQIAQIGDAAAVERELDDISKSASYAFGILRGGFVTEKYAFSGTVLKAKRAGDIVLAYSKAMRNGRKQDVFVVLKFNDGMSMDIAAASMDEADEFIDRISERLPIITDYTRETAELYKRRDEFMVMYNGFKNEFLKAREVKTHKNE